MNETSSHTMVNPQNSHLAFKIFSFENISCFDHIQRLGYYSMILIYAGKGKLNTDLSVYDFHENMLICFSPYQPFMLEANEPVNGFCIHFHPDFFCIYKNQQETSCNGVLFNNIYDPPFLFLQPEEIPQLNTIAEGIRLEMTSPGLDQSNMLISYLKIFLITASRIKLVQKPTAASALSGDRGPFILQKLKDAIETHFKSKHTASDYAKLLHISPKALARICRNYFDKTITDLIAERIVIEAKRQLYLTGKSVKEIAWELGYEDEHYFSRFFKRNADISPQFYRDRIGFARALAS
jgi:AraC family transcriptional regulator, transcriptional activator of pobA